MLGPRLMAQTAKWAQMRLARVRLQLAQTVQTALQAQVLRANLLRSAIYRLRLRAGRPGKLVSLEKVVAALVAEVDLDCQRPPAQQAAALEPGVAALAQAQRKRDLEAPLEVQEQLRAQMELPQQLDQEALAQLLEATEDMEASGWTLGAVEAEAESIVQVAAVAAVDIMGAQTQETLEALAKAAQPTHRCARAEQGPLLAEH